MTDLSHAAESPRTYPAGRELDALIAEKVMGWTVNRTADRHWHTVGPTGRERGILIGANCCPDKWDGVFSPSTDIAAAWEVVEKLNEKWFVTVAAQGQRMSCDCHPTIEYWRCSLWPGQTGANAQTAPLAICLAALKAVS